MTLPASWDGVKISRIILCNILQQFVNFAMLSWFTGLGPICVVPRQRRPEGPPLTEHWQALPGLCLRSMNSRWRINGKGFGGLSATHWHFVNRRGRNSASQWSSGDRDFAGWVFRRHPVVIQAIDGPECFAPGRYGQTIKKKRLKVRAFFEWARGGQSIGSLQELSSGRWMRNFEMVGVSRVAAALREFAVPDPVRFGLARWR